MRDINQIRARIINVLHLKDGLKRKLNKVESSASLRALAVKLIYPRRLIRREDAPRVVRDLTVDVTQSIYANGQLWIYSPVPLPTIHGTTAVA